MIKYTLATQFITIILCLLYCKKPESEKLKYYTAGSTIFSAILATIFFISQINSPLTRCIPLYNFITTDRFSCGIGLLNDSLSITAAWVVCTISAIANCYSIGYINKNLSGFLCGINAFSIVMVLFTASHNLLQMFIFWELLSVASYFLIAFNNKEASLRAAFKTIMTHKFGDIGFVISMIAILQILGSLDFEEISKLSVGNDFQLRRLEIIAMIMLLSVFVKSAQVGATSWLKNAMHAPAPASALIHASTLVTAGIFVIIRLQNIFECSEFVQNIIIAVGLVTSAVCAIKAIFASNIKQIFAYSTCSQVGLMLTACGFSAYSAAVILFVVHAFAKSLLFFSTGSVIHALSGEQDIENMGGLFELLPKTYIAFITATASMIGIPLLPYYYAKKVLLNEINGSGLSAYYIAATFIIIVSFLTSVYLFRTIYLVFHGETKLNEKSLAYVNENDGFITKSLYVSMFFAVFSGVFFYYAAYTDVVWKDIFAFSYASNRLLIFVFSVINIFGIAVAVLICKSIKPKKLSLEFYLDIDDKTKNFIEELVQVIETKLYKKCYLYFSKTQNSAQVHRYYFVCFLLVMFVYLTSWIKP